MYGSKTEHMLRNTLKIAGITNEGPGLIDVLNVGDSVCNVSLTPMELFRDYGYTAYNMGREPVIPSKRRTSGGERKKDDGTGNERLEKCS